LSSRQKHALQVYVVDPVPTLLAGLDRATDFDDADIVVEARRSGRVSDASIDDRGNVLRTGHISSDRFADAAFRLDNSIGFERGIEIDIGCENLCSLTGEEHRRRLTVPQPGPLEPAPESSATFSLSLSRSPMLSSSGGQGEFSSTLAVPRFEFLQWVDTVEKLGCSVANGNI
jgi:hypothetical protein